MSTQQNGWPPTVSRPIDPTRHGRVSGATDSLEAVRHARLVHVEYEGRHRAAPDTPAQFRAPYLIKSGGCGAPKPDVIVWRREP